MPRAGVLPLVADRLVDLGLTRGTAAAALSPIGPRSGGSGSPEYPRLMSAAASAWIFQCNPKVYDARRALRELPTVVWVVRQHRDLVAVGDEIFFWLTGGTGIVARGPIVAKPSVMPFPERERPFLLSEEDLGDDELRVPVRVDHILPEPISREQIKADHRLSDISILRTPMGSNFPLDIGAHQVLAQLTEAQSSE